MASERQFADDYRQHGDAVYTVAAQIGGPHLAAEVAEEVFLRHWRHPERFDPRQGSLRAFLVAVTRNLTLDALPEHDRRGIQRWFGLGERPKARVAAVPAARARRVKRALAGLAVESREAILMAYFGGLSHRDIALVCGVREGDVQSRIRAGLRQLRVALGDCP